MTLDADELFTFLKSLELPLGDYAVFGSGPLIARGIIDAGNDLDIVSRGPAWDRAIALGESTMLEPHGVEIASFLDGAITVGRSWAYGDPDIDELIETAEMIDGLPFVRLEYVVEYKRIAGRAKDIEHLRALAASSWSLD